MSGEELGRLREQLERLTGSRATLVAESSRTDENGRGSDSPRRVIALLVGWTSCSVKSFAKHAVPYASVGIPAVVVAPSLLQVWSGSRLTRSLLTALDRSLSEPASLVLHAFSASPGLFLPPLVSDFESRERELTRKLIPTAAVFDSGPTRFSLEVGMAAARLVYQQGGYSYPTYLASICGGVALNAAIGRRKRREMDLALQSPLLDIPQLYLHSRVDPVARLVQVCKVMLDQQAMGREVSSHCWEDTQHVRHFQTDPVTYEHLIHSLLKKCQLI